MIFKKVKQNLTGNPNGGFKQDKKQLSLPSGSPPLFLNSAQTDILSKNMEKVATSPTDPKYAQVPNHAKPSRENKRLERNMSASPPVVSYEKFSGADLPDVGEESLEILLDWYEKHPVNPKPNKIQMNKIAQLTGLNKSTIRIWMGIIRKNKPLIIRTEDGNRYLAKNPFTKNRKVKNRSTSNSIVSLQDQLGEKQDSSKQDVEGDSSPTPAARDDSQADEDKYADAGV